MCESAREQSSSVACMLLPHPTPPHPTHPRNMQTSQKRAIRWFGFQPVGINIHKPFLIHLISLTSNICYSQSWFTHNTVASFVQRRARRAWHVEPPSLCDHQPAQGEQQLSPLMAQCNEVDISKGIEMVYIYMK